MVNKGEYDSSDDEDDGDATDKKKNNAGSQECDPSILPGDDNLDLNKIQHDIHAPSSTYFNANGLCCSSHIPTARTQTNFNFDNVRYQDGNMFVKGTANLNVE